MIPVAPQPEPATFDALVRRPGKEWLKKRKIPLNKRLAPATKLTDLWVRCLDDLYEAYGGVCAYLGVFFERSTGAGSVDHFVAKSRRAGQAYEWSNYRLACRSMNGSKSDFDDVLDPFTLAAETFRLELVTGRIYPNPALDAVAARAAQDTIERLGLDDDVHRRMRARHFTQYGQAQFTAGFLRAHSPFVWYEAHRQGLL